MDASSALYRLSRGLARSWCSQLLAVLATYGHLVLFKGINAFVILLVAYLVLLAGTLFRSL